jgi:hypothetical protein
MNRPFGRPRHRRGDNIGIDFRELGGEGLEWMHLAEDSDQWQAPANMVRNLRVA